MTIQRFSVGPEETVSCLNQLVDALNLMFRITGDPFIRATGTPAGITLRLNIDEVLRRTIKYRVGGGSGGAVSIAEVIISPNHESDSAAIDDYTVQKINSSGVKDGTDITIDRAMGYEGYGTDGEDIRNFIPWFGVGARVPIIQHFDEDEASAGALKWFFYLPMTFIGKSADRSLDVEIETTANESEYRTMAVWK